VIERTLELMASGVEIPDGAVQQAPRTADGEDLEQAGHMSSVVAVLEQAYGELGPA
jgi:hypothetical protein